MDFLRNKAQRLVDAFIRGGMSDASEIISKVKTELYNIDEENDKVKFINIILEGNQLEYNRHLEKCTAPETCQTNQDHEEVNYYLQQELRRIGVTINEDSFSGKEKEDLTEYLDKILSDLKDLKDGQKIIYDDLKEELEELKKWFIIGKKNWRQMAVGKFGEMVAGGIISESTAKPILDAIKKGVMNLIS